MAQPMLLVMRPVRRLTHDIIKNRWAYAFISPFFILFFIFQAFPIGYSVYLSLHEWNGIGPMKYVELKNYEFLMGPGGKAFQQSLRNGIILFFMYVPIMTLLSIVLAVLLNSKQVRGFRDLSHHAVYAVYHVHDCRWNHLSTALSAGWRFVKCGSGAHWADTPTLAGDEVAGTSVSQSAHHLGLVGLQHGDYAGRAANHPTRSE